MPKQHNKKPQSLETSHPPAPLWRRIAAIIYDSLLVGAIILVVTGLYHGMINNWLLNLTEAPTGFNPWLGSLLVIIVFFFFAHFWGLRGQTLGMQAWRLRIQSTSHRSQRITLHQSLLRFTVAIPALGLAGLGLLWMTVDRKKRSWHDLCSQTEIVLLPK